MERLVIPGVEERGNVSPKDWVSAQSPEWQSRFLASFTDDELEELEYEWDEWLARPAQLAPALSQTGIAWRYWMLLAGRGYGKTRTGAEWVRDQIENHGVMRGALVAATSADVRDTMVLGDSGLLSCCPPWNMPEYLPSKRIVRWPNGAQMMLFSADEPARLRGPQHEIAWADELCVWKNATGSKDSPWDMLLFGLRKGKNPRVLISTTPKPTLLVRNLVKDKRTAITSGSTYENKANLADSFLEEIITKYEGTRLGRQEIYAELLVDMPGALWTQEIIDKSRWNPADEVPHMRRIVVGVDPSMSSGEGGNLAGISVVGKAHDGHGHVLADGTIRGTPDEWAKAAVAAYHKFSADRIVGEVNQGGDLVEKIIRTVDPNVPFTPVRATRGKYVRAEPVAAMYEQGRIHHHGVFEELERQMCLMTPDFDPDKMGYSPDNLDALVWACHNLFLESGADGLLEYYRATVKEREEMEAAHG